MLGILGLVSAFVESGEAIPRYIAEVGVPEGFGYLFGLFHINVLKGLFTVRV